MAELEQAFEQWKTMAELQLKFIQALGPYKLDVAKSELVEAVASGEWALARMKARVAQELEFALRRLHRLQGQTSRRIERFDRHSRDIAKIRSGEDMSVSQLSLMWGAYTVFERLAPITVLEGIINTPVEESARSGRSYVDLRRPDRPCSDAPVSADNVHSLIGWIKRRRYVPRRGSEAYRQVITAFAKIAAVAQTEIAALRAALIDLEKGTYDTWQPVLIAALPDSVDARKIIRLGTK